MNSKVGCTTMIVIFLIATGMSWVITSGFLWLICWLIGWDFSMKIATAIWLVLMLVYGSFSK